MTSKFFGRIHEKTLIDGSCHVLKKLKKKKIEYMLSIKNTKEKKKVKQNKKKHRDTYPKIPRINQ